MAITKDLSDITIDLDNDVATIVDGSTYSSPARSAVGVFVKVYKVDVDGARTELETTGNDSDPNTDDEWEIAWSTDGWHQIFYVAVPDWAVASYSRYDAVYDYTNNIVYRSKVNSNSVTVIGDLANTTNWEVISEPTSLCLNVGAANESANITAITGIDVFNTVFYAEIREAFEEHVGSAFVEATSDYKRSQDVRLYELLGLAIDGIKVAINRLEYSLGEIIARRAISIIQDC